MPPLTPDQALALATQFLQSGRLAQAEAIYMALVRAVPDHAPAWQHLGLIARRNGQPATAAVRMHRALALAPASADAHANLGTTLQGTGRAGAALAAFDRALVAAPELAAARFNRGNLRHMLSHSAKALADFTRAIALEPAFPEAYFGCAEALQATGTAGAAANLRRALICRRAFPEALINLSNLHQMAGAPEVAALCLRRALVLEPGHPDGWMNLAVIQRGQDTASAAASFRRALLLRPGHAETITNLATTRLADGYTAEADALYRRALAIDPGYAAGWYNFGCALLNDCRHAPAVRAFACAVTVAPGYDTARMNLGMTLLQLGDYERGWLAYEARLADRTTYPRVFNRPQWRGEDPAGRTILLHAEQGFGDTIQFARYIPMVAARGARVVLEAQPNLLPLLRTLPGVAAAVVKGGPPPAFDLHCPLLSLPLAFGTRLDTIPAAPYLHADPALAAHWKKRLEPDAKLRVGLIWAGSATFKHDRLRSPRLEAIMPLLEVPGVRFFALQMGDGRRDLEGRAMPVSFTDLGPEIRDFSDTAAIMGNLDLVVSSCTGPAHLAAALGRPTWIVVPFAADWRWLLEREDSPWYPTVRLFRQNKPGAWSDAVARMAAALFTTRQEYERREQINGTFGAIA